MRENRKTACLKGGERDSRRASSLTTTTKQEQISTKPMEYDSVTGVCSSIVLQGGERELKGRILAKYYKVVRKYLMDKARPDTFYYRLFTIFL